MQVKLLSNTPLEVADIAICKCYGNEPHTNKEKVKARINRVANVSKHASTIEHLSYSFDIDGISRACLQELARHRIASYTVKSSRYTLQELKNEEDFIKQVWHKEMLGEHTVDFFTLEYSWDRIKKYVVLLDNEKIDINIVHSLQKLKDIISGGITNDLAKYIMPEAYKTSLVMTINARSLQNFLELRSSKHALWEIQDLAKAIYEAIPNEHKFLFDDIFKE